MNRLLFTSLLGTLFLPLFALQSFCAAPPAPVPKTGQTTTYQAGDDGYDEAGVAWPVPRFIDNGNGTVTDSLTGLVWLRTANCFSGITWSEGLTVSSSLSSGFCGLGDGSIAGKWRLPSIRELKSLLDRSRYRPPLAVVHPFGNVQAGCYWSSTTKAGSTDYAWTVSMADGNSDNLYKARNCYVWPVRAAQ